MFRVRPFPICLLVVVFGWIGHPMTIASVLEQSKLARAARSFRLQVYETYRGERVEFDRRTLRAQKILNDWKRRGSPADEEQRLIRWYVEATRASRPNHRSPLPGYGPAMDVRRPQTAPPIRKKPGSKASPRVARIAPPQRSAQGVSLKPTDRPLPQREGRPDPLAAGPARAATRPSVAPPATDDLSVSPVDLAILTSRIRSFNLTLTEIEGELSRPGPWRVEQLAVLIDQVERLFSRRQLSQLYYDALTPQQRQLVEGFAATDLTLALLDQRLFEARVALMDANSGLSSSSGQGEMKQLRSLSRKIKSWTVFPDSEADER